MLLENVYGHLKRLNWIREHLTKNDSILEFGCGTGYMICLPLQQEGYRIEGLDLDPPSIEYGKSLFSKSGADPARLHFMDLKDWPRKVDTLIASEVLEHNTDEDIERLLHLMRQKLKPGGFLLVTVPNGYGWFELESFLWFQCGIGKLLSSLRFDRIIIKSKKWFFGPACEAEAHPSSLSTSPHIQRFTFGSIQTRLQQAGFEIQDARGSVLFAGPFSHLIFGGIPFLLQLNTWLGDALPRLASGFFIACKSKTSPEPAA